MNSQDSGGRVKKFPDVLPTIAAALAALGLSNNLPDYEVVDTVHGEAYQGNNNQIYQVCIAKPIILDWIRILLSTLRNKNIANISLILGNRC